MKKEEKNDVSVSSVSTGGVPMGTIVAFMLNSDNIPKGWLPCNGTEIPSQYQDFITALGKSTTPNLSGRTITGAGTTTDANSVTKTFSLNATGGEYTHELSLTEMPSHQHLGWGGSTTNWGGDTGNSTNKGYTGCGKIDSDNKLAGSTYTGGNLPEDSIIPMDGSDTITGNMPGTTSPLSMMQPYYTVNFIIYTGEEM
jgi:microcystin-dependent protein